MNNFFYIHAISQFSSTPQDDKEIKKQLKQHGIDARRMSRFTQLSLLGALPLKNHITQDTGIYLGSNFSSPSKFNKIFSQLNKNDLPSPLDFMANLNNSATFQIAQYYKTHGASIFLAINQQNYLQPLELAINDLMIEPNKNALIGWVFEHYQQEQTEGFCWMIVNTVRKNAKFSIHYNDIINNTLPNSLNLNELLKFI